MANEIYNEARDGIAALVSRQAADGILRRAVERHGSDPDAVDAALMSRLLRGDVRRALERSLPKQAVRMRLSEIDGRLPRSVSDVTDVTDVTDVSPDEGAADPVTPDEVAPEDVAPNGVAPTEVAHGEVPAPAPDPVRTRPAGAPRPPEPVLDRLGDLDAVRQWIWSPQGGEVLGRGAGPEPRRAQRVVAPLLTVLDRDDAVRSVHVQHGRGHVVIGRSPAATLTVAGDPDLNLGAIHVAFRALEEEP